MERPWALNTRDTTVCMSVHAHYAYKWFILQACQYHPQNPTIHE